MVDYCIAISFFSSLIDERFSTRLRSGQFLLGHSAFSHLDLEALEQWDLGNSAVNEVSVLSMQHFWTLNFVIIDSSASKGCFIGNMTGEYVLLVVGDIYGLF